VRCAAVLCALGHFETERKEASPKKSPAIGRSREGSCPPPVEGLSILVGAFTNTKGGEARKEGRHGWGLKKDLTSVKHLSREVEQKKAALGEGKSVLDGRIL